jgi:hypothetical protein
MAFTTSDGEFISLDDAKTWTANHRNSENYNGVKALFYGKAKVAQILQQQGCVGLRVYYAIDDQGLPVLVLIGTDAEGNDIESSLILERGIICPPNCGGGDGSLQV